MENSTRMRKITEAKRMGREHALHAAAHLAAGRYKEASNQFGQAAKYADDAAVLAEALWRHERRRMGVA